MSARILALAGSTRRESYNARLVRIAADGARDAAATVTVVDLADHRLPVFDQDEEAATGKPAPATALKRLWVDHDALLIASPEYNGSITGVLKNTIDWVSRPDADDAGALVAFRGKVVTLMSASPGALGGLRGLVHLRAILSTLGCLVLPDQAAVPHAGDAFDDTGALVDARQHQRVRDLGRILAETTARLIAR